MFLRLCVVQFTGGWGGVGFLACITGHMTRGLHPGGLHLGVCLQGGLHPWGLPEEGSASRGVCLQEGLPPGGLPPGESDSRWVCIWGSVSRGVCIHGVYLQ